MRVVGSFGFSEDIWFTNVFNNKDVQSLLLNP